MLHHGNPCPVVSASAVLGHGDIFTPRCCIEQLEMQPAFDLDVQGTVQRGQHVIVNWSRTADAGGRRSRIKGGALAGLEVIQTLGPTICQSGCPTEPPGTRLTCLDCSVCDPNSVKRCMVPRRTGNLMGIMGTPQSDQVFAVQDPLWGLVVRTIGPPAPGHKPESECPTSLDHSDFRRLVQVRGYLTA